MFDTPFAAAILLNFGSIVMVIAAYKAKLNPLYLLMLGNGWSLIMAGHCILSIK